MICRERLSSQRNQAHSTALDHYVYLTSARRLHLTARLFVFDEKGKGGRKGGAGRVSPAQR